VLYSTPCGRIVAAVVVIEHGHAVFLAQRDRAWLPGHD